MAFIEDIFSGIGTLIKAIWDTFWEFAPKVVSVVLWLLCGIFILPCIFVAGTLYPEWVKWGEDL